MALKSLGKVTIASGGTPVRITANESVPAARYSIQGFVITPGAANAGIVYVGTSTLNTGTGAGVLGLIPKPVSATTGPFTQITFSIPNVPGGIDASGIYVDGTTNDIVYVAVIEQ